MVQVSSLYAQVFVMAVHDLLNEYYSGRGSNAFLDTQPFSISGAN